MRCRQCDYSLWNLKTRTCPECGLHFAPSAYRFVPNSVRYCCPHCEQEYYGTDAEGHLVPRAFECVQCGRRIEMDEMVLRPAAGVRDDRAEADLLPWLGRRRGNWFRSWGQTVWQGMVGPSRLAESLPAEASTGEAWWFVVFSMLLFGLTGAALPFGVIGLINTAGSGQGIGFYFGMALGYPVAATVLALLFALLWSLSTHVVLVLTGGCARGLGHTMQALCYTCGPMALLAVPCVGPYCMGYVAVIWWVISAILAVMAIQKVHGGRATLATLVFPVVLVVLLVSAYFGLIFYGMSMASATASGSMVLISQTPADQTGPLTTALLDYSSQQGEWPDQAQQLVAQGSAAPGDFVTVESDTILAEVPLSEDLSMDDLDTLTPAQRREAFQSLVSTSSDGLVAHRAGDFVFTYHGIDPNAADPNLWLVVQVEDPDARYTTTFDTIHVGLLSGRTLTFMRLQLAQQVRNQNALRAEHGLPPLPQTLDQITRDTPVEESP